MTTTKPTEYAEHTFLFAVEVEGDAAWLDRDAARATAYAAMKAAHIGIPHNSDRRRPTITWWHADADRTDGSDNALAAFDPEHTDRPAPGPLSAVCAATALPFMVGIYELMRDRDAVTDADLCRLTVDNVTEDHQTVCDHGLNVLQDELVDRFPWREV